jgi:hypothetical protein
MRATNKTMHRLQDIVEIELKEQDGRKWTA